MFNGCELDKYWTIIARVLDKTHATVHQVGDFVRRRPFQVFNLLKTVHRIKRTSPDKECIRRRKTHKKRIRNKTQADGYERIENVVLRRTSVNVIRLCVIGT